MLGTQSVFALPKEKRRTSASNTCSIDISAIKRKAITYIKIYVLIVTEKHIKFNIILYGRNL